MSWPILIASFFPVVVYLTVGLRARAKSVDDYFVYGQQVSPRDYANTSVGYALQMAAIFLFADWGARYGLGALWTVLFWFLGFALLYFLLPRFLDFHSQRASTLHQYLTSRFHAGHAFQRLAALATIVGLWGTMMSEVDYTTQIYDPIFPTQWMKLVLGALLLLFGVIYTIVNGYKAEVNTERFQVPIAFGALLLVLILMLPAVWVTSGGKPFLAIFLLLLAVIAALIYGKTQTGIKRDPQTLVPLVGLLALLSVTAWTYFTKNPGSLATVIAQPVTSQLRAQGFFGLLSLKAVRAKEMASKTLMHFSSACQGLRAGGTESSRTGNHREIALAISCFRQAGAKAALTCPLDTRETLTW
jgi:Na+/proline symporter